MVCEGDIVMAGGLTSGIHMALHLVARDFGVDHAARTARQLDLPRDPTGVSSRDCRTACGGTIR